jgi:hypothetical protein
MIIGSYLSGVHQACARARAPCRQTEAQGYKKKIKKKKKKK